MFKEICIFDNEHLRPSLAIASYRLYREKEYLFC
jgi:hypothetical protein